MSPFSRNHTIPRTTRGLQLAPGIWPSMHNHTIPRTTRGLQRGPSTPSRSRYHTIPRTTRGLQPHRSRWRGPRIIPYQELRGDYNNDDMSKIIAIIIPYQELRGDYNSLRDAFAGLLIIPYQELRGDYNKGTHLTSALTIIPYQELRGHMIRFWFLNFYSKCRANKEKEGINLWKHTIPRILRGPQQ